LTALAGAFVVFGVYLLAPRTSPAGAHPETDYFQSELSDAARLPPLLDLDDLTGHISPENLASISLNIRELNVSLAQLAELHRAMDQTISPEGRRAIDAQAVAFRIEADRQKHLIFAALSPEESRWFHQYVEARAQRAGLTHDVWSVEDEGESRGVLRGAGEHARAPRDSAR
jgi:hypothetical protein